MLPVAKATALYVLWAFFQTRAPSRFSLVSHNNVLVYMVDPSSNWAQGQSHGIGDLNQG